MPKISAELPPAFDLGEDHEEYVPVGYGSGAGKHPFEKPLRLNVENTREDFQEGTSFQFYNAQAFMILVFFDVFAILLFGLSLLIVGDVVCVVLSIFLIFSLTFSFVYGVQANSRKQFQRLSDGLFDGQPLRMTIEFSHDGIHTNDAYSKSFMKWELFRIVNKPVRQNGSVLLLFFTSTGLLFYIIPRRALPPEWTLEELESSLKQAMECVETGRLGTTDQVGKQE